MQNIYVKFLFPVASRSKSRQESSTFSLHPSHPAPLARSLSLSLTLAFSLHYFESPRRHFVKRAMGGSQIKGAEAAERDSYGSA
jgi:hypothetical protein